MTTINNISLEQGILAPEPSDNPAANATIDTATLVKMIQAKNEQGFHILYDKYSGALYSILIKFVRRTDVAEDLLQEVFLKIWKHIDGFDPARGTLFTWMLNIARNKAIDYLRSSGYQWQLQKVNIDSASLDIDTMGNTTSNTPAIEYKDLKSKTQLLEPKYAEVIDLIFFFGWTYDQTAQRLNLPIGTVKTRARKALALLKEIYQQ